MERSNKTFVLIRDNKEYGFQLEAKKNELLNINELKKSLNFINKDIQICVYDIKSTYYNLFKSVFKDCKKERKNKYNGQKLFLIKGAEHSYLYTIKLKEKYESMKLNEQQIINRIDVFLLKDIDSAFDSENFIIKVPHDKQYLLTSIIEAERNSDLFVGRLKSTGNDLIICEYSKIAEAELIEFQREDKKEIEESLNLYMKEKKHDKSRSFSQRIRHWLRISG